MDHLERIIAAVNTLPTLPTVFAAISEAMEDPRTSADKLAQIISTDQVSALKVLKVANSPFFGFRGRIDTISEAVFYLGFNEIRNIVFALSVINSFSKTTSIPQFQPVDFWAHSIAVGIATRVIGAGSNAESLENYFLGGILHDIGKLIFFQFAKKDFIAALEIAESKKISLKSAEGEIFKFDHSVAGHMLAQKWKLPVSFQNVILYHHSGVTAESTDNLIPSVYLGNIVAKMLTLGRAGDDCIPKPNPQIWDKLKLPAGYFSKIRPRLEEDFNNTVRIMLHE